MKMASALVCLIIVLSSVLLPVNSQSLNLPKATSTIPPTATTTTPLYEVNNQNSLLSNLKTAVSCQSSFTLSCPAGTVVAIHKSINAATDRPIDDACPSSTYNPEDCNQPVTVTCADESNTCRAFIPLYNKEVGTCGQADYSYIEYFCTPTTFTGSNSFDYCTNIVMQTTPETGFLKTSSYPTYALDKYCTVNLVLPALNVIRLYVAHFMLPGSCSTDFIQITENGVSKKLCNTISASTGLVYESTTERISILYSSRTAGTADTKGALLYYEKLLKTVVTTTMPPTTTTAAPTTTTETPASTTAISTPTTCTMTNPIVTSTSTSTTTVANLGCSTVTICNTITTCNAPHQ